MDLKNITVEDLKEKFAAFDKKTLIKFGIGMSYHSFPYNLFCNFKANGK